MGTGSFAERRTNKRRRSKIKLRFWNANVDKVAYATDVSSQGLFIETRQALPIGTRVHIELLFSGNSFFAEGMVTHSTPAEGLKARQKAGLGVRLLTLGDALAAEKK